MVYRRRTRKTTYKKRRYSGRRKYYRTYSKKRYAPRKSYSNIMLKGLYAPDKVCVKFRYQDFINVSAAPFTAATVLTPGGTILCFNGSNAYDPNYYSTGGSCTAYGDFTRRYDKALVLGCKIVVQVDDDMVTGTTVPYMVTLYPKRYVTSTPFSAASIRNLAEERYCSQKVVEISNNNPRSTVTLKGYMTAARIFGVSKSEVKNSAEYKYDSSSSVPPTNNWGWFVYFSNPWNDGEGATIKAQVRVLITYYVQFSSKYESPTD